MYRLSIDMCGPHDFDEKSRCRECGVHADDTNVCANGHSFDKYLWCENCNGYGNEMEDPYGHLAREEDRQVDEAFFQEELGRQEYEQFYR